MNDEKFDIWNNVKKEKHFSNKQYYPKSKEVWYISMWINIWSESNWKWDEFKRPVLVLKRIWSMFLVVSMTTKWNEDNFHYKLKNNYFNKDSFLTLSQFKTIDNKRFIRKIWKIDSEDYEEIKKRIKNLF